MGNYLKGKKTGKLASFSPDEEVKSNNYLDFQISLNKK